MVKRFLAVVVCFLLSVPVFAAEISFDELKNNLSKTCVEPMAKDIGSVLAGNMFRSGTSIGTHFKWVPGIQVGVAVAGSLKPREDNVILQQGFGSATEPKDAIFGLPFAQVGLGLPFGIDVVVRGAPEMQEIKLMGVGLKKTIIERGFASVKIGLSAMYSHNRLEYTSFKAETNSFTGIFSVKVPLVEPYIGVAIDKTSLETEFTPTELMTASNPVNIDVTTTDPRYVAGLNFYTVPLTYINIAGTYLGDHMGVDVGVGLKF
ncbi:MAG: hypothetical protein BWY26_00380 [Elusimicrobia bacterium ADurb.Bin231]|nr:MAG: hypothetical protein BWY26_00380 [Elusimicrobia bacterium ADurb.Bin231]